MPERTPTRAVWVAIAACTLVLSPSALAHGGQRLGIVHAGGYLAEIYAALVPGNNGRALDVTVYLRNQTTTFPVDGATVRVRARPPDGPALGPHRAQAFTNSYEVLFPIRDTGGWRRWRLRVEIDGPLGPAAFTYSPPGVPAGWTVEPPVIAAAGIALLAFLHGFWRLRRRGRTDLGRLSRALVFALGTSLIVVALASPLDPIGERYLASAHMFQHVLIGDIGPALIMVGLAGPLLYFIPPRPMLRSLARSRNLRRALTFLTRPTVIVTCWALVYAIWHTPPLYELVLRSQAAHDAQHACFLAVGVLVWYRLAAPGRSHTLSPPRRLGLALAIFAAGQVLSLVLIASPSVLYAPYAAQPERLLGISALTDQRLAGLVMMIEQMLILGILAAVLIRATRRRREAHPQATERPATDAGGVTQHVPIDRSPRLWPPPHRSGGQERTTPHL